MSGVPGEDLDRLAHSHCPIRIFTGCILEAKDAKVLYVDNDDSDQTARMRSLI